MITHAETHPLSLSSQAPGRQSVQVSANAVFTINTVTLFWCFGARRYMVGFSSFRTLHYGKPRPRTGYDSYYMVAPSFPKEANDRYTVSTFASFTSPLPHPPPQKTGYSVWRQMFVSLHSSLYISLNSAGCISLHSIRYIPFNSQQPPSVCSCSSIAFLPEVAKACFVWVVRQTQNNAFFCRSNIYLIGIVPRLPNDSCAVSPLPLRLPATP